METKKVKNNYCEMVNERIRQLMLRDQLVKDFQRKLNNFYESNPHTKQGLHVLEFPSELQKSYKQIGKKWNVPLIELTQYGTGIDLTQKILTRISEMRPSNWQPVERVVSHLIKKEEQHLYLDIDLTTLDMNDAKEVKQQVWKMINNRLQDKRNKEAPLSKIKQPRYKNDRPELAFIYHMKEEVFQKYLWWYDIHQNENFSFRIIAYIDKVRKRGNINIDELIERFRNRKTKWGIPERGEDAVEKGIKLIYKAIHGVDYSTKNNKDIIEEYNCPLHGNKCPLTCKYSKDWMRKLDKSLKKEPSRIGRGQSEAEFEAMIYPQTRGQRRKPPD